MSNTLLKLVPGSLPENYVPVNLQQFYNRMFELGRAIFPATGTIVNFGSDPPDPDDQGYPWIRTDPITGNFDRVYVFQNGYWASPHPIPPSSDYIAMWAGDATSLETFDGGSAGVVDIYTGPMWQVYTEMEGRFPIGPGTLPVAGLIQVLDTGGSETHTLVQAELPLDISTHFHGIGNLSVGDDDGVFILRNWSSGTTRTAKYIAGRYDADFTENLSSGNAGTTEPIADSTGAGTAFGILPPYKALYFIKRTARAYYTV